MTILGLQTCSWTHHLCPYCDAKLSNLDKKEVFRTFKVIQENYLNWKSIYTQKGKGISQKVKPLLNYICDDPGQFGGSEIVFKLSQTKQDFHVSFVIMEHMAEHTEQRSICIICFDKLEDVNLSCCKSRICTTCLSWQLTM